MYQFHLLLIFCAINLASSQSWYNGFYSTPAPERQCTQREATSFTLIVDSVPTWDYYYTTERLISRVTEAFPCGDRQYTFMKNVNSALSEYVFTTKDEFFNQIRSYDYYYDYYRQYDCNLSLLGSLKRALEISPAGTFILVLSGGSMLDYDNTELLNEVYNLLDEKQSQIFFMVTGYCDITLQRSLFNEIASQSFGQFLMVNRYSIQQALYGLDLLLAKPVNSSVRILNVNLNVSGGHREEFNITSLTYLLITTSGDVNVTFSDPTGNNVEFEKQQSYISGRSLLIKQPASGSWILDVISIGSISVKILGFTGNCSNSECHPNATCEEFGGYQECTCKQGFVGDGSLCYDVDECADYWLHRCNNGYCQNSIGAYNCSCFYGFIYTQESGCIDIDECSSQYLNDCHPLGVCTNTYGGYMCRCPYGYYGDGRYCEINECQHTGRTYCPSHTDCTKSNGSFSCNDPCSNYTVLDENWRSTANKNDGYYRYYWNNYHCDNNLKGWYRFQGQSDQQIPEYCVESYSCGTHSPIWLNGSNPTIEEGIVNHTACASWYGNCCMWSFPISIRTCPGGFYVYKLEQTPFCNLAYCVEPNLRALNCSSTHCAPDEECRNVNGVSGCHCKHDSDINNGLESSIPANYTSPELVCGINQIKLSYSKCQLEKMGYDTSAIHLRDHSCTSFIERDEKSYVTIEMLPRSGYCGAQFQTNASHLTYINTVYLIPKSDGLIKRSEAHVNFYCAYPMNMEVSLWIAVTPLVSTVNFFVGGTGSYSAKMALFRYSDYSMPYEGTEVWLTTESMLYVGIMVEENKESNFALVMKNCYATPTSENWHPVKYYIIKNNCPNHNDPTISVAQNGVSLQGRFSLQVFTFIGSYNQVYLHCEIRLCDKTSETCNPECSGRRLGSKDDGAATKNLSLGPLRHKASAVLAEPQKAPAVLSSGRATTASLASLILTFYSFLMISE
ncbi:uromodulin-like isoform X2 [Ascaphus truei]|uniref:uromodulin-like isoform X2 n=1 Tax=Ascaphus truei TaxID=8439 RepID=UPI003F596FEA